MIKTADKTPQKLAAMLKENTGRALCDSGDYYGRNWQRNQGADFEAMPPAKLEFDEYKGKAEVSITLNVYHWLKERVTYNAALDRKYRRYCEKQGEYRELPSAEAFAKSLPDAQGLYGDRGGPFTVNTYNGECLLSQTLQFVYWEDDNGAHVLLQIHGGCDVRGGYTDPVAFDVSPDEWFDVAQAVIYCTHCRAHWGTDDGYHFEDENGDEFDFPATTEEPEYPGKRDSRQRTFAGMPKRPMPDGPGVIWVEGHKGHCPKCGGLLEGGAR